MNLERLLWIAALAATAFITRLVVRRKQSALRLKEAEQELRDEKAARRAEHEQDRERRARILKRALLTAVNHARGVDTQQ